METVPFLNVSIPETVYTYTNVCVCYMEMVVFPYGSIVVCVECAFPTKYLVFKVICSVIQNQILGSQNYLLLRTYLHSASNI